MLSSITLVILSFLLFSLIISPITIFTEVEICCQWYEGHVDDYEMTFKIVGRDKKFELAVLKALKEWQNGFEDIFSFTMVQDSDRTDVIFRQVGNLDAYSGLSHGNEKAVTTILGDDETNESVKLLLKY